MFEGFYRRKCSMPKTVTALKIRNNGAKFETLLERYFALQNARFGHVIEKTPEPMRVLSSTNSGVFNACFVKRAQPDFKGVLKGGRACVLEAKSTMKNSFVFDLVKEHQIASLFKYEQAGAFAGVILALNDRQDLFLVPINDFMTLPRFLKKKSASIIDLERYRITLDGNLETAFTTDKRAIIDLEVAEKVRKENERIENLINKRKAKTKTNKNKK